MIEFELPDKPELFTDDLAERLTQEFVKTKKRVWNIPWLKEAVAQKSFGKCCYSDILLNEESKYMEIDHFAPKDRYPERVMDWSNLNPSCKTCNAAKGDHDVFLEEIINPFFCRPKDYLYFKEGIYCGRDAVGKRTVRVLDLNNKQQFVQKRYRVAHAVKETLEEINDNRDLFQSTPVKSRNHLKKLKNLMAQGNRKEEYAALVATTIVEDANYQETEQFLRTAHLWNADLDALKAELHFCALPQS